MDNMHRHPEGLHVHVHYPTEMVTRADLVHLEQILMATLDNILEQVRASRTVLDGLDTLLDGLREEVRAILSGARLPAGVQEKVDAVFTEATAQHTKLQEVLLENTPTTPVPPVPPVQPEPRKFRN